MRRLLPLLLLLGIGLLMTGCIAEFLGEGAALEGMAGAEAGALGAAEAAEAAAASAAEAEASGAIAARVASGELSVDAGALRSVFAELTDGGAARTVDLDSSGALYRAGRAFAQVEEDGAITIERGLGRKALVGRVADGKLWMVDARGALRQAVGELRGFVPGAGVELYDNPFSSETTFRVLDPHSVVEILERRGGWLEIRLVSGEKGWVWSPLVAVTALLGAHGYRQAREQDLERALQPSDEERCVELASGQLLRGRVLERVGAATHLALSAEEQAAIDDAVVAHAEPCRDAQNLDWTAGSYTVALETGAVLYARSYQVSGGAAVLTLGDGARVFVSRDLLSGAPIPPRALEEAAPSAEPGVAYASLPAMERSVDFRPPPPEAQAEILPEGPAAPVGAEGWRRFEPGPRPGVADDRWRGPVPEDRRALTGGFWGRAERPGWRYDGFAPREPHRPREERWTDGRWDGDDVTRRRVDVEGFRGGDGDRWARPEHRIEPRPEARIDESSPRGWPREPDRWGEGRANDPQAEAPPRRELGDPGSAGGGRWQRPEPRPPSGGFGWRQRPAPPSPSGGFAGGWPARPVPAPRPRSRPPQTSPGGSHHSHG